MTLIPYVVPFKLEKTFDQNSTAYHDVILIEIASTQTEIMLGCFFIFGKFGCFMT